MKIFDGHSHIGFQDSLYNLSNEGRNIIFNDISEYQFNITSVDERNSVSLILDPHKNTDYCLNEINNSKIVAAKIHSRISKITNSDYGKINDLIQDLHNNKHIIYDAFYYGSFLEFQPSLKGLVYLIRNNFNKKFIVAHSGGHKILDYFFHLRDLENVYYCLSFTLQYLYDTSRYLDIKKLVKYVPSNRILFGSDFPYTDPEVQVKILLGIMDEIGMDETNRELIFYTNSKSLFKPDH